MKKSEFLNKIRQAVDDIVSVNSKRNKLSVDAPANGWPTNEAIAKSYGLHFPEQNNPIQNCLYQLSKRIYADKDFTINLFCLEYIEGAWEFYLQQTVAP